MATAPFRTMGTPGDNMLGGAVLYQSSRLVHNRQSRRPVAEPFGKIDAKHPGQSGDGQPAADPGVDVAPRSGGDPVADPDGVNEQRGADAGHRDRPPLLPFDGSVNDFTPQLAASQSAPGNDGM